jgi:hypothetical protein
MKPVRFGHKIAIPANLPNLQGFGTETGSPLVGQCPAGQAPLIGPLDAPKFSPLRQIYGTVCQHPHWSFVAGHHMNYVPTVSPDKKTIMDGACSQCGAQPKLAGMILDSVGGRIVRMFECEGCGKQAWAYEPKQAHSVGH